MIGKTVSHYRILEKLGEGGMGVVYKAEDTKLKRTVALKFLRSQTLADQSERTRFLHEAQAAAALDHPNICTVYEVNETDDQTYISMAYIEGQSLRKKIESGPLELNETLDIAVQVAEGLRAAHKKGIIHRDIKSANVMVTDEGRAKVMDFGLAKSVGATKVTRTGMTLGTVAYMSPEQALGKATDHRTDVWSLGVVLYELLTAQMPFKGEYDPALMYSIVNEEPEPVTSLRAEVPLEVEQVVEKALVKDADKRYQSVDELIADLEELRERLDLLPKRSRLQLRLIRQRRRIALGAVGVVLVASIALLGVRFGWWAGEAKASLVVLPFENISADAAQEYLIDGITGDLIANLTKISALKVISRASAMRYKGTDKPLKKIGEELDVRTIIVGTVQLTGEKIEVYVELVHATSEQNLWQNEYNKDLRDIEVLLNDISLNVVKSTDIELTPREETRLAMSYEVDPLAYKKLLEARHYGREWTEEGFRKALALYREALDIDPLYASAHAGIAMVYESLGWWGYEEPQEASMKATAAAKRALELDDEQARAHAALGFITFQFDWDWWGAEPYLRRAVELRPNDAGLLGGLSDYLCMTNRFDEAIELRKKAIELDPLTPTVSVGLGWIYFYAGRYDESIAQLKKSIELNPRSFYPYMQLSWNYVEQEMYAEAIEACDSVLARAGDPNDPFVLAMCAWVYGRSGRRDTAQEILEKILAKSQEEYVSPHLVARIYLGLGDREKTFEWLERGYEARDTEMIIIHQDFNSLSDDPRYEDLCRRIGIPTD